MSLRSRAWKGSVRKSPADHVGRMWEALAVGVEVDERDILGNKKRSTMAAWEKWEKSPNKVKGMRLSQCHHAQMQRREQMVGRKESGGWIRKQDSGSRILASKNQEHYSTESVNGSLQITLARSVLWSKFSFGFSRCWKPLIQSRSTQVKCHSLPHD